MDKERGVKMKKIIVILLSLGLVFSMGLTYKAEAKTRVIKFANCKEMNKVYRGGVAKSSTTRNKGGKIFFKPFVSSAIYYANTGRDRDKDGIACER
jgi:hypothetical protein